MFERTLQTELNRLTLMAGIWEGLVHTFRVVEDQMGGFSIT